MEVGVRTVCKDLKGSLIISPFKSGSKGIPGHISLSNILVAKPSVLLSLSLVTFPCHTLLSHSLVTFKVTFMVTFCN